MPEGRSVACLRIAVLRSLSPFAMVEEIVRNGSVAERREEPRPRSRLARQDHVTGFRVAANEDLRGIEPKRGRKPDRLAAAVGEQLGDLADGSILHGWHIPWTLPHMKAVAEEAYRGRGPRRPVEGDDDASEAIRLMA